jgi:hypothetical protein
MAEIVLSVDVDAPASAVWAGAVDWEHQNEWMIGTRVWPVERDGAGVGGRFAAFTGVGPLGFLDPIVITAWDPPRACRVRHTGRVVRGAGAFEVEELPGDRARFVWSEWLDLPLGRLGEVGFLVVGPVFSAGVERSLQSFGRWVERRHAAGETGPARAQLRS